MAFGVIEYNAVSKSVMGRVFLLLDSLDDPGVSVSYKDGVITADVKGVGTYVVNRQPPKKEIWLSSPISGPHHFQLKNNKWTNRSDQSLFSILSSELALQDSIE